MTEQEAVERLKCMRLFMQINDNGNENKFLEDDYIANYMAIKSLEKQIPKKIKLYIGNDASCPECGKRLRNYEGMRYAYCKFCGKALEG